MSLQIIASLLVLTLHYATSDSCNICGEGNTLGNLYAAAYIDMHSGNEVLCTTASAKASTGVFDELTCSFITQSAFESCQCIGTKPEPPHSVCNICGGNNVLSSLEAHGNIAYKPEGGDPWTCAEASAYGDAGLLSESECTLAHFSAHSPCQCSGEMLERENAVCNICGGDDEVQNSDAKIFEDQYDDEQISCHTASAYGAAGLFDEDQCTSLSFKAFDTCGCPGVPPEPACNICGVGNKIMNFDAIINKDAEVVSQVSCREEYDKYGVAIVEETECSWVVSQAFGPCACTGEAPVEKECNVCGDGYEMKNFDAIAFVDPLSGNQMKCDYMSKLGTEGLSSENCEYVMSKVAGQCGCTLVTESPTAQPTATPTVTPTEIPTETPTHIHPHPNAPTSGAFASDMAYVLKSIMLMCASMVLMH